MIRSVAEDAFGGWHSDVLIQSSNESQSLLMILRTGGDGEGPLGVGLVVSWYSRSTSHGISKDVGCLYASRPESYEVFSKMRWQMEEGLYAQKPKKPKD